MHRTMVSGRSQALLIGGLVVATYLTAVGALALARATGTTAAWFPAAGVAVVAAMLASRRHWPALLCALGLAFALANLTMGRSVLVSTLLGLADIAETALVAHLLLRYVGRRMSDVQDVWRLFGIATLGALVAATGISLTYMALLDVRFSDTIQLTLPSHAASITLIAPLALLGRRPKAGWSNGHPVELAIQLCVLAVATVITFGAAPLTLGFAPLPVLVWAAVRFTDSVVVVQQVVFATVVTLFTQLGFGPFSPGSDSDPGRSTQHAQLYLICLVLIGLPLVKAMQQRDEALDKVLASERTFRRNFTESRVPVTIVSWDGHALRFVESNQASYALLGRTSDDLAGTRVEDVLHSPELDGAARAIAAGDSDSWHGMLSPPWQVHKRLDATLSPIEHVYDVWLFSLLLMDVTESQELQERLQAEKDYTRAVIDTASSMIVVTSVTGTVIAVNPATSELTGFSEEELVGHQFWDMLIPDHQRDGAQDYFGDPEVLPLSGETLIQTKSSGPRTVVFSNNVYRANPESPIHYVLTAVDVTAARENAGMVSHLLRSARTIAFIGTDLDGRITLFNTGAEEMLGVEASEVAGRDLTEFVSDADLERYVAENPELTGFAAIVGSGASVSAPETRDWTMLPHGRQPRQASVTTNPVTDTFGQVFGYLFVARDVTDTRRSQEILVKALRREREVVSRLKDLDRAKDDFVSTVSHELRTPMSSIIGSTEMLADGMVGELLPEQKRMVDVIARNGDRLLTLADDLLLLAAFDTDTWQQQGIRVDLASVVDESASAIAQMLSTRELDLVLDLPESPVHVLGDPGHLERAVTNLLTNAVKFTPDEGRITVRVTCDQGQRTARIDVVDTGLGIPEEELEAVFAKFFRSSAVQEQAIQGSGLGLAIVKTIVESHEGRIDVRSQPGTGTTFTIRLPLV